MKKKGIIAFLIIVIAGIGTGYLINEGPKTEVFEPLLASLDGGQVSKLQTIKGNPTNEEIDKDMSIIEMNNINLYTRMLYEYSNDRESFNKNFNKYINLYNSYMAGDSTGSMYDNYYINVENLINYYNSVDSSNQEDYNNNNNEAGVSVGVGIRGSRYGGSDDGEENTRFNGGSSRSGGFFGLGSGASDEEGEGSSRGGGRR